MKILVCLSQIPDTTSKINFTADNQNFDPTGVQFIINPSDESAINKALEFKEKLGAEVSIIHIGEQKNEATLRKAFALGCDKMIRVDTQALDGFQTASEIFSAIKNENFDMIFCGKESLDFSGGMVGGILAELLNYDFVGEVISVEVSGKTAIVESETDEGKAKIEVNFPVVLAVQKEIIPEDKLKIPNMRGIMSARTAPISVLPSCGAKPKTSMVNFEKPEAKPPVKMFKIEELDELVQTILS